MSVSRSVMFDSETPCTRACQASLSMEFSRKKYWSRLPFSSPWDLPDPGIEPTPPALQKILYHLSYLLEFRSIQTQKTWTIISGIVYSILKWSQVFSRMLRMKKRGRIIWFPFRLRIFSLETQRPPYCLLPFMHPVQRMAGLLPKHITAALPADSLF